MSNIIDSIKNDLQLDNYKNYVDYLKIRTQLYQYASLIDNSTHGYRINLINIIDMITREKYFEYMQDDSNTLVFYRTLDTYINYYYNCIRIVDGFRFILRYSVCNRNNTLKDKYILHSAVYFTEKELFDSTLFEKINPYDNKSYKEERIKNELLYSYNTNLDKIFVFKIKNFRKFIQVIREKITPQIEYFYKKILDGKYDSNINLNYNEIIKELSQFYDSSFIPKISVRDLESWKIYNERFNNN